MPVGLQFEIDKAELRALGEKRLKRALTRAYRKAGSTALRDMRSEASKRVRRRKRLKAGFVRKAMKLRRAKGSKIEAMEWALDVSGEPVRISKYPHRQTRKGVSVGINKGGKRTLIRSAFVATMPSGHKGVFLRRGAKRLPITEPFGSRVTDALLHDGEVDGVYRRGTSAFEATFERVLPMELEKLGAK